MFKKKTFSEIWNKKQLADEQKINKKIEIRQKKEIEIENMVMSQFRQAKKIIGEKLQIEKLHGAMFHISFGNYIATLYSFNRESNGFFELYHYIPLTTHKLENFKIKIKLKELSQRLIQYARLVLETKGIEV